MELAYAPITAYEFAVLKDDVAVEKALEDASLYVIGQRPVMTFENIVADPKDYVLSFEIHKKGKKEVLKCTLPLIQKSAGSKDTDTISIGFNYLDKEDKNQTQPLNNVRGFTLHNQIGDTKEFLLWFSPEKLLQNWWKNNIECEIIGDYRMFLEYKVHYVGKATKQSIIKRLTGHSTLQDILSLETPVTDLQLPANEITILCFKFGDNLQIQSFGPESDIKSMAASLRGDNYPDQEKVFLDAEKALIKAMEPDYNKELFKNYPKSKDGLYDDNYDAILYTFLDPIKLIYNQGEIDGGLWQFGGDSITVLDNEKFELLKYK